MPQPIDWLYRRKSCATCQKADGYLARVGATPAEVVDATKVRYAEADALDLLADIDTLIATKGKKVQTLDLRSGRPADAELLALLMGPTGNLRAPTARVGRTLLVGFHADAYGRVVGS